MDWIQRVRIQGTSRDLFTDRLDARGQSLIHYKGVTQPKLTEFWLQAVKLWRPTLVIDVGVNYGEVMMAAEYDKHAVIIGVEANTAFKPYHELSIAEHPNRHQMQLFYAIASDREQEEQEFYINKEWSGNSTAGEHGGHNEKDYKRTTINSITIDSVTNKMPASKERCLFKIDVEGFEGHVMKGMERLFKTSKECVGHIEFSSSMLKNCGTDPDQLLSELDRKFDVYVHLSRGQLLKFKSLQVAELNRYFNKKMFRHDLVLIKSHSFLKKTGLKIKHG
ncbi:MAG: hypothetical protein K0Q81_1088 [Paenibacillus sp.]|nr:hypothetical protein [Paenibacillus sp.]